MEHEGQAKMTTIEKKITQMNATKTTKERFIEARKGIDFLKEINQQSYQPKQCTNGQTITTCLSIT